MRAMTLTTTVHPPSDRTTSILEAACRVIVREGSHGLRMAGVAEEAGVSKALVHYYFSTRQELLHRAFAFSVKRWHAAVEAELVGAASGREKVDRILLAGVEPALPFSEQKVLWNEVWSSLRSNDELRPLVEELVPRVDREPRRTDRGGTGRRVDPRPRSTRSRPAGASRPSPTASTRCSTST